MVEIHHIALRVNDCLIASRFYQAVVGLREVRRVEEGGETRAVWLRGEGGAVLMLERRLRGEGPSEGSGHVLVFATTDLAETEGRLLRLGVVITDRTPSTIFVADPDGHRAGFSVYPFDEKPVIVSPRTP